MSGLKGASLAVRTLIREEYASSGSFQSEFVAELPYPHILLRKRLVADRTGGFEIRLSPARSGWIPVADAEFSRAHTKRASHGASKVEIRVDWWRVLEICGRLEKVAAFFGWLEGLQSMRVDKRSD